MRSVTSPPSRTRSASFDVGEATQIAPSASRQMPSGTARSGIAAQTRRFDRLPSARDVERGQPRAERLADDQRLAVGRDDGPVRKDQFVGGDRSPCRRGRRAPSSPASARRRAGESRSCRRRRGRLASTTMSLQCQVAMPPRSPCTTARPSDLDPHQLAVVHRDYQHPPVRQPAQAGDGLVMLEHRAAASVRLHRHDLVGVHVGEHQLSVAPARPLRKRQSPQHPPRLPRHRILLRPRQRQPSASGLPVPPPY